MADLPTGTVTFLFTDIEGSTRLWEQHPEAMRAALARHDTLAAAVIEQHAGTLVKSRGEGDTLFAVFARPTDALAPACTLQQALLAEPWPAEAPLRVRVALHTGEADQRGGDYYGATVNPAPGCLPSPTGVRCCCRRRSLIGCGSICRRERACGTWVPTVSRTCSSRSISFNSLHGHLLRALRPPGR
jgi:hypothetical protein